MRLAGYEENVCWTYAQQRYIRSLLVSKYGSAEGRERFNNVSESNPDKQFASKLINKLRT